MFLFQILSLLDLFASVILISSPNHLFSFKLVLGMALYLIVKAYIFKGDFLSVMDAFIGINIFIAFFFPLKFICYFLGIILFLKSFYSLSTTFYKK